MSKRIILYESCWRGNFFLQILHFNLPYWVIIKEESFEHKTDIFNYRFSEESEMQNRFINWSERDARASYFSWSSIQLSSTTTRTVWLYSCLLFLNICPAFLFTELSVLGSQSNDYHQAEQNFSDPKTRCVCLHKYV